MNEIAPRVHNSAHYSIEALQHSQFALHLMAVTHQDLPDVRLVSKAFAMTNLIGNASKTPDWPSRLSGNLHWYGKKENSKGRKIGHVTYLGTQSQSLVKLALKERKRMKL